MLYFLVTFAEPSQAPRPFNLLSRPPGLINPAADPALAPIIARCLAADPAERFVGSAEVDAALVALIPAARRAAPPWGKPPSGDADDQPSRARRLARRLGETFCAAARPASDGAGLGWLSARSRSAGFLAHDLNAGSAGPVLALAELAASRCRGCTWARAASARPCCG